LLIPLAIPHLRHISQEKAACSVSVVKGKLTKERASSMSSRGRKAGEGDDYFAAACSLVFHSASPKVPTFR
jgi:coproporphyrinogen III oxidase